MKLEHKNEKITKKGQNTMNSKLRVQNWEGVESSGKKKSHSPKFLSQGMRTVARLYLYAWKYVKCFRSNPISV